MKPAGRVRCNIAKVPKLSHYRGTRHSLWYKFRCSGRLHARGRDIEEVEKAVTFNKQTCTWSIEGDADDIRRSTQQQTIMATLREAEMAP
jgi:hypothetical protein